MDTGELSVATQRSLGRHRSGRRASYSRGLLARLAAPVLSILRQVGRTPETTRDGQELQIAEPGSSAHYTPVVPDLRYADGGLGSRLRSAMLHCSVKKLSSTCTMQCSSGVRRCMLESPIMANYVGRSRNSTPFRYSTKHPQPPKNKCT